MKVLVTGTSSGIGRYVAERLYESGAEVWGLARRPHEAPFQTSTGDVSKWDDMRELAWTISSQWGTLNAVICAAAIQGEIGPAMALDPNAWSETIRVNLDGSYYTLRALFPLLSNPPAGHRAKIICFAGGGAANARPFFSAYAAAKCAVVRLVETLAAEWSHAGVEIDINAIAPGAIVTRMTEQIAAAKVGAESLDAQRRIESGGDDIGKVMDLIRFLLAVESDGITGRFISAQWDAWQSLSASAEALRGSEALLLRRVRLPEGGLAQ